MNFQDALALALLHNPKLSSAAWSVRVSEARAIQAGLRPNPGLDVEVEEFGGEGPRREFQAVETTVRLSQLIELGGKRGARIRIGDAETILAGYDYEAERLVVLTNVTISFIDVLTGQMQLDLADNLYRLSQEMFEVVAERVSAGKVSPLEKTKASIELGNRKIERLAAASKLRIARRNLAAAWGSTAPRFKKTTGSLDPVEEIPPFEVLQSLLHQNPAVARWAGEMERCLAELALERAERIFDLTLSAGFKQFNESDDHAFTVGLSLPIPLFDRNQGSVREARYRLAEAEYRAKGEQTRVKTALFESYEALAGARAETLALEDEIVPAAGQAFDAARHGYRQGKFDYLEVLDAQRTYAEANARLLDARARYHRAVAIVEGLVGTRLDSLLGNTPSRLEDQP